MHENNEISNNNIDLTPIIEELQVLSKGVNSSGEKLDIIAEYLVVKDKQQREEQAAKEEDAAKLSKSTADQSEIYTELLTDIRDQAALTNNLLSGQIFFMGVLFGIILLNVLWSRFIR